MDQAPLAGSPVNIYQDNVAPIQPDQEYLPIEPPAAMLAAPVAESDDDSIKVQPSEGEFNAAPGLLDSVPARSEDAPYVEPRFDSAPPEVDGVGVPELDADTGFLSPQNLSDSEDESVDNYEDPNGFDSVMGPTEADAIQRDILQSADAGQMVVLKARPVMNHRVNNQGVLRPGTEYATNRTDTYRLPVARRIQFAELPPLDSGTRSRPIKFERSSKAMPPVKHLQEVKINDKSTRLDSGRLHVVESTTNRPTDAEPMLRMTAIQYEGASSLGSAIARIKIGKTPLIVRGAYPRDLEHERQARERNDQATRSVIIPNTSLKTIDR